MATLGVERLGEDVPLLGGLGTARALRRLTQDVILIGGPAGPESAHPKRGRMHECLFRDRYLPASPA